MSIFAPALSPRHGLLVLFCLCLWLPGLFTLPPTDRDESRFAQATEQMLETHDFVRIMNGDVPRNRKPIGIYWAQIPFAAAARSLGLARGNPIWPYRLPSLLGALLAVLAVAEGGTVFGDRRARAAWFLAASLLLSTEAHLAKTDALLLGATTVAMLLLGRAFVAPQRVSRAQAAGFWVALAAGVLIKGPITPMIAGLTLLTLGSWTGRWRWLLALRPLPGLGLALLLVLPWFAAIGLATHGAFFAQSLGGDLAGKLAGADDAHGAPFGTYLALLPATAFPAVLPLLRGLPAAWRDRGSAETRFLIAWIVPAWLLFELVPTKLPHYVLPLYPGLFLLAARFAGARVARGWRGVGVAVSLAAAAGLAGLAVAAPLLLHAPSWVGLPAGAAIVMVAILSVLGRMRLALTMWLVAMACVFEIELQHLPALAVSSRLEAALAVQRLGGRPLAAAGYAEPSLMFLADTHLRVFRSGRLLGAWLAATPRGVGVAERGEWPRLLARDPAALRRAEVSGYDYSNGKWVTVGLFTQP